MRTEDSTEPKKTRDRLINTRRGGIGDCRAEQANDPSNERCAEAGHRDHQSTHPDREGGRGSAEHTPCWSRRRRTAHYEMKVGANQRGFTH